MLQIKDLSYQYPGHHRQHFPDIEISAGDSLLITGASGKGKSTMLFLMSGMLQPHSGSVLINNTELSLLTGKVRDRFRGRNIGIVFQTTTFVRSLSVYENIRFSGWLANSVKPGKNEIYKLLADLDIEECAHKLPDALSVGQRQRASIARGLIHKPGILLADEPTASLDDKNADKVANLLLDSVAASGTSLVVVTHDRRLKKFFNHSMQL